MIRPNTATDSDAIGSPARRPLRDSDSAYFEREGYRDGEYRVKGMQDSSRQRALRSSPFPLLALGLTVVVALAGCGTSSGPKSGNTVPAAAIPTTDQPSTATTSTRAIATPADPLAWATSVLNSQGYTPVNTDQYSTSRPLRILVGKKAGAANMRVFFFIGDGRWLGTDTTTPSGQATVAHQGDNTVQVTYSLYRPGDADSNPTGGTKTVTFKWNGTKLIPLDAIPSADPKAVLSRR
ncbi:MAG: hypothetical protein F2799_07435 [Actinobacteria bacterium]|uniref:Unannotated protein n=1 Tax=freshwater metagenome TaxID=449393 RepID=A0A6J7EE53_9ZZZZ|nr:hypothetical protein [Actinomycetota bacterium]